MNTTNTFLRYFNEQTGYETFASIADVQYVGNPIDPDSGKDLDYDRDLYFFDGFVTDGNVQVRLLYILE